MSREKFKHLLDGWKLRSPKLASVCQTVLQQLPEYLPSYAYYDQGDNIRTSFNALLSDIVSICLSENNPSTDISFRVENDEPGATQWQYEYQQCLSKVPIDYLLCIAHILFDCVTAQWHIQSPLQERGGKYTYHYQALAAYHLFPKGLVNDLPLDELLVWYYQLTELKVERLQNRYLVISNNA